MIDTHAHLTEEYYEQLKGILEQSTKELEMIINSATNDVDSKEVLDIANQYNNVYASVGIHPTETGNVENIRLLAKEPKVIAIGEIGLDYHHKPVDKENQISLFKKQLDIAKELNKPVIIHSRDATSDVIEILKDYPNLKGIVHCFSGSIETARIYTKMGYKIGIGGVLTFKNSKLIEVVEQLDLSDIVIETDSPFLSPEPYRGKVNQPDNVRFVYNKLAEIKGIPLETVIEQVRNNVRSVFDFLN